MLIESKESISCPSCISSSAPHRSPGDSGQLGLYLAFLDECIHTCPPHPPHTHMLTHVCLGFASLHTHLTCSGGPSSPFLPRSGSATGRTYCQVHTNTHGAPVPRVVLLSVNQGLPWLLKAFKPVWVSLKAASCAWLPVDGLGFPCAGSGGVGRNSGQGGSRQKAAHHPPRSPCFRVYVVHYMKSCKMGCGCRHSPLPVTPGPHLMQKSPLVGPRSRELLMERVGINGLPHGSRKGLSAAFLVPEPGRGS